MKRLMILVAAAAASVSLVATAPSGAAVTAAAVRGAGTVLAHGTTGPTAGFTLYLNSVKGNSLVYNEPGVRFHALTFAQPLYSLNAVTFSGLAVVNGKTVHYTAIAVEHPKSAGVFKLAWNHLASRGGVLTAGNVVVVPQASS